MRWARSYSIVDHQLLHGGYCRRLSHQALTLYLFVVVVGDSQGKSFYADPTIGRILRLSDADLALARNALIQEGLITYHKPYWWVNNLSLPQCKRPTQRVRSSVPTLIGDILRRTTDDPKAPTHA